MAVSPTYPVQLDFRGGRAIARWRPLVQWLLAIPHLFVAYALSLLRGVLVFVSFFTVVFTRRVPRPLFDLTAMTYRYEWRATSYALFLHEDYPPFDFQPGAADDGSESHSLVTFAYPEELSRWKPLYKWLLAIPHYVVLLALMIAGLFAITAEFFVVVVTGEHDRRIRDFLVDVYRYNLRVQAYVCLLNDEYPPFTVRTSS